MKTVRFNITITSPSGEKLPHSDAIVVPDNTSITEAKELYLNGHPEYRDAIQVVRIYLNGMGGDIYGDFQRFNVSRYWAD